MGWWTDFTDGAVQAFCASGSPTTGPGRAVQKCFLRANAQIVAVGFAEKPKASSLFGGTRAQYVNLSEPDLVAADSSALGSINQLGRTPPIAVKVTPAQSIMVRLRLVRQEDRGNFPAGSETLSAREAKLDHLTWASAEDSYSTDENGELLVEPGLSVAAAAGYKYRVEAALPSGSFTQGSNWVEIRRRFYIHPVVRYASGRAAGMAAFDSAIASFGKYQLEVRKTLSVAGNELGVWQDSDLSPDVKGIGNDTLATNADAKKMKPHGIAIILGEFVSLSDLETQTWELEFERTDATPFPPSVTIPLQKNGLWYVVVPLTNGKQVVKASVRPDGLTGWFSSVDLPKSALAGVDAFSMQVVVDLGEALKTLGTESHLTLTLSLKCMRGWAVGWAYPDTPVIYLNMRDPNTNSVLASAGALALVVHEVGHKLHLTSDGSGSLPDKQPHHYPSFSSLPLPAGYTGGMHQGPHCSTGVPAGTNVWDPAAHTAATCTMWGSLKQSAAYCPECLTVLRKVDLSGGF